MAEKSCTVEGCGRTVKTGGLCGTHYKHRQAGRELAPLRAYRRRLGCEFASCDRAHFTHGLCRAHYAQRYSGRELTVIRRYRGPVTFRDGEGRKLCRACDEWKPEEMYGALTATPDGLKAECKACIRDAYLKRTYNIGAAQYDAQLAAQGGVCAICALPDPAGKALAVDHDHACCSDPAKSCGACVRGLLCWPCNVGIGHLRDDAQVLRAAADYLERAA